MAGSAALDRLFSPVIPAPIAGARLATLTTIRRMGMTVMNEERSGGRWTILAMTENQRSKIDIRAVDYKRTRMDVKVSWDQIDFVKDPAVANEFIKQTVVELTRITFKQIQIATAQLLLSDLGYDKTKNPRPTDEVNNGQASNAGRHIP